MSFHPRRPHRRSIVDRVAIVTTVTETRVTDSRRGGAGVKRRNCETSATRQRYRSNGGTNTSSKRSETETGARSKSRNTNVRNRNKNNRSSHCWQQRRDWTLASNTVVGQSSVPAGQTAWRPMVRITTSCVAFLRLSLLSFRFAALCAAARFAIRMYSVPITEHDSLHSLPSLSSTNSLFRVRTLFRWIFQRNSVHGGDTNAMRRLPSVNGQT